MQGVGIGEAKTWETERPDELGADLATCPRRFRLWRCAEVERPHFGRGSFWTPTRAYAEWFARWKAATYPELRPLGVYGADLRVADAAVIDLRRHLGGRGGLALPFDVSGAAVLAEADRLARRGIEWVLTSGDDPLGDEGAWWSEAIYVGSDSVEAVRSGSAEADPLP